MTPQVDLWQPYACVCAREHACVCIHVYMCIYGRRVAAGSCGQGHPSRERYSLAQDSNRFWDGTNDRSKVKGHSVAEVHRLQGMGGGKSHA